VVLASDNLPQDSSTYWRVFGIQSVESVASTGIQNLQNVTMNSRETEEKFRFQFMSMKNAMKICIQDFERQQSYDDTAEL
jgi:hypothetical protein